ncbi:leucyl aminopeptidase [Glaciecola punicea ACAM 611]|jgi:leucyl aminopeptidase|uniref:Probable cytosol aminopeptidase n=1 Tax=Glaciecola punicea ACAM 611 TaxID=1121923 RepID=H5T8L2_9ALTE|nr:leucyl aminopeptidase [Glaciecola punicea]OFA30479.1 leucyl aminopeptidase [Glaciecola punicea]GAB54653.1 leucyl aminopeptidase [Glaciecola punicea ACAM 611]
MEFGVKSGSPEKQRSACVVVGVFEPRRLTTAAEQLDQISEGYISNLIRRGDLEGKAGQMLLLHHVPNVLSERVLLVGCGKERELDERQYKQIVAKTIKTLNETGSMEAVSFLTELHVKGRDTYWKVRQAVEAANESVYSFSQLKTKKGEPRRPLRKMIFNVSTRKDLHLGERAVVHATAVSKGVKVAKDVSNMPPNICNPKYLNEQSAELVKNYESLSLNTIGEAEMEKLGMHTYLAVGRGSHNESIMSVIHHKGGAKGEKPYVLVGKGLTFDSGGISLKPGEAMDEMKYDMCGASSVLGVMHTVAELKLPINIIGVIAGCENMPDANAYRPGDILTTMSGQTVEILNTDAEGRLVLCDALTYVERFDPELVIDIATLTGACVIALGKHASAVLTQHNPLAHEILNASEQSGDRAWRLPLWEEYQDQIDSPFADMTNLGGRAAGAITAACFLARFTRKYTWAHLDIAGTAWLSGENKGATGRPVPMLSQFLMNKANIATDE